MAAEQPSDAEIPGGEIAQPAAISGLPSSAFRTSSAEASAFEPGDLLGPVSHPLTIQVIRTLFVVISASLGWQYALEVSQQPHWYHPKNLLGLGCGLSFGLSMVVFEIKTSKQFAANIFTVVIGLFLGFIGSQLFFQGLLLIPHLQLMEPRYQDMLKLFLTLVFCYLSIVVLYQGRDQFKLVIPFVETGSMGTRGRSWLLDTSVIIDGRIEKALDVLRLDNPIVIPEFVIQEVQALADSSDRLKRQRGQRGLDVLTRIHRNRALDVTISEQRLSPGDDVDSALIELARTTGGRVISNDVALHKVGDIKGVQCVNLNELANALRWEVLPGEQLSLRLVKPGEQPQQGLGYLDDGTLVVVENGRDLIGKPVDIEVTSILPTQAGRMVFAKLAGE